MPTYDRTITAEENRHKLMEAVGHLEAAHTISDETIDCITLGDFNYDPKDVTERATFVNEMLQSRSYDLKSDTKFQISGTYTHKCGRTLDRIIATTPISSCFESVCIKMKYYESDHFPVVCNFLVTENETPEEEVKKPVLRWDRASDRALQSKISFRCLSIFIYFSEHYSEFIDTDQNFSYRDTQ